MLDELNRDAAASGGVWVKLNRKEHGVLKGIVLEIETREKTYEGKVVLSSKTGKPRKSRVVTLLTDQRSDDIDEDSGVRKFDANESAWREIVRAVKEAKATAESGDTLTIKVEKDPETSTQQADYKAKWEKGPGVPEGFGASTTTYEDDEEPF
jgi:hypothetical protein